MMERYQKAMGRIHAPADTKKKLLGSTTHPRKRVFARVLPVAACLLLLAAGCVGLYFKEKTPALPTGQSYDNIYEAWFSNAGIQYDADGNALTEGGSVAGGGSSSSGGSGGTSALGHYETHMQTEGVLEPDIQKTDGQYLWRLSRNTLYTYRLAGEETELLEITPMPAECSDSFDMFLWEDRLVVIGMSLAHDPYTCANLYEIDSDTGIPRLAETFWQSGIYENSRIVDGELYLATRHLNYLLELPRKGDVLDIEIYIPRIAIGDKERLLKPEEIYLSEEAEIYARYITFVVVSAIDLEEKWFDSSKAVLCSAYDFYASAENIYLFAYGPDFSTNILCFAMDEEDTILTASGTVKGYILNQFSVDEHDGYLRVATCVVDYYIAGIYAVTEYNAVYVLNKNLKVIGALEGIQPDERILSARFSGDLCYLVTFHVTDPLFAVDLSNPRKPEILSELKVTGFSSYLYEYGEGLLLGIGAEGTETGKLTGWKLSMFDVTDPDDVTEITNRLLSDQNARDAIWYDHKNLMISEERNLIGIPLEEYQLYAYDAESGAFVLLGQYDLNGYYFRGTYAGKYCYVTSTMGLIAIDLESYEVVAEIDLTV